MVTCGGCGKEGGVPSVGPGRGGKSLTGVDGPNGWNKVRVWGKSGTGSEDR